MKAMILRKLGPEAKFELAVLDQPKIGSKQVLVKVMAASINPVDYKIKIYESNWAGVPMPAVVGFDAAGVVEEVGHGVHHLKKGDRVYYSAHVLGRQGTFAEYHAEDADIVHKIPAGLSFEEAASLPLAGMTAYDAIITFFQTKPTDTILIHAGAGGVGSLAVQIARVCGARVIATGRKENEALIRSLGADEFIDYQNEKFENRVNELTGGIGADAAYDTVGGDTIPRSTQCVRAYGKLATIVNVEGSIWGMQMRNQTLYYGFLDRTQEKFAAFSKLVERGLVKPLIDSILPMTQVEKGIAKIQKGGMKGKLVLKADF